MRPGTERPWRFPPPGRDERGRARSELPDELPPASLPGAIDGRKDLSIGQGDLRFAIGRRGIDGPIEVTGEFEVTRDGVGSARFEQGTAANYNLSHEQWCSGRRGELDAAAIFLARPWGMLQLHSRRRSRWREKPIRGEP